MANKKLYATLIGINNYPKQPLGGCVHDALEVDKFLRELSGQQGLEGFEYNPLYFLAYNDHDLLKLEIHSKKFHDFDLDRVYSPTFKNISEVAFNHLKNAKEGDICLFYFSGHGSTMHVPEQFHGNKSKLQHETLVCVDSRVGARDLLDKEIAFLLWDALQGKNVHCLVIMDCCFAGNNTRAIEGDTMFGYRHVPSTNQNVRLEDYLGYDKNFFHIKPQGGVDFPIARYVQLAASLDNQTARETASEGGLFTSNLLDVLKKGGSARSYRDLMQTTRVSVRNSNPNQTPVEYAIETKDLDQPFLGGGIIPYKPSYEVRYDTHSGKWKLFGGAMDGINSTEQNPTKVTISGTDKEFIISEVFSDFSYLDASFDSLKFDQNTIYQAVITKYATPLLQVGVSEGILEDEDMLKKLEDTYGNGSDFPFIDLSLDKSSQSRSYQIRQSENGNYVLVRTGSTLPIFKSERNPKSFLTNTDFVGKWLVACELKHTNTQFAREDFIFKLERIEGIPFDSNNIERINAEIINADTFLPETAEFRYRNGCQPAFRLSIEINPDSNLQSCYVGALYLESKYRIRTDLIRPDENHLVKGGAPISLKFNHENRLYTTLPLSVDEKYDLYHINDVAAYLKIIVSDKPFSLDIYAQDELKLDDSPNLTSRGDLGFVRKENDTPEQSDWCVFTSRILTIGPKKKHELKSGAPIDFCSFTVEVPEGFHAHAYAITGDDIIGGEISKAAQLPIFVAPPADLFGNANTLDQPFPGGISGAANNSVQALELRPVAGEGQVNLANGKNIKIKPKSSLRKNETILPFGYDEVSGFYFPIGYTDSSGIINIEKLPPPSGGVIEEKSLGGSIKLFFQKVVWSKITGKKEYNRLTLHRQQPNGRIKEINFFGTDHSNGMRAASEIKDAINGGEALLLLHGIIGDTSGMLNAILDIDSADPARYSILTYDFENLNSGIEETAKDLKEKLKACGFEGEKRITILSHSMGGLVSRYMIEQLDGDSIVKKLIQCGTPNSGSELSDFRKKVTGWLMAGINGVALFQPYLKVATFLGNRLVRGLFRNLDQMDPDSSFMIEFNKPRERNIDVPYYLIGGDTGQIRVKYDEDLSMLRKIFETLKSRGLYLGLDHLVFENEPNDMAVKISRMQELPWGTHEISKILACDHISYFKNEESLKAIRQLL